MIVLIKSIIENRQKVSIFINFQMYSTSVNILVNTLFLKEPLFKFRPQLNRFVLTTTRNTGIGAKYSQPIIRSDQTEHYWYWLVDQTSADCLYVTFYSKPYCVTVVLNVPYNFTLSVSFLAISAKKSHLTASRMRCLKHVIAGKTVLYYKCFWSIKRQICA